MFYLLLTAVAFRYICYSVAFVHADLSPAWPRHQNGKNDTNLYNVSESIIFIEKSSDRRLNKLHAATTSISPSENSHGHVREKRNPLLDRVKHTRLSCFKSSSSSQLDSTSTSSSSLSNKCSESNLDSFNNNSEKADLMGICSEDKLNANNGNLPRTSFLSTKLRAVSERYLQSSTNKFLTKLYKNNEPPLTEPTSSRTAHKRKGRSKLRSFSYGALPGLEEFEESHSPILHTDDNYVMQDNCNERVLLMDNEDSDSGILVNDSASSLYETDQLRSDSRLNSSLEETRNPNVCDFSNQRLLVDYSRERNGCPRDRNDFQRVQVYNKPESSKQQFQMKTTRKKNTVLLIRLKKSSPDEELGILIAKGKIPGQSGYIVADITPNGLAQR